MSEETTFKNIKALGLSVEVDYHDYQQQRDIYSVKAEDLEKLLAAAKRVYMSTIPSEHQTTCVSIDKWDKDTHTALLLDIKPLEKPKPKRSVVLYKWERITKDTAGTYYTIELIREKPPGGNYTKVPGSERVVEVDDEV